MSDSFKVFVQYLLPKQALTAFAGWVASRQRGRVTTALICPVDGAIRQFGAIKGEQICQDKGHQYSTTSLLGGDAALAAHFRGGSFASPYLCPRNYHRTHMRIARQLTCTKVCQASTK